MIAVDPDRALESLGRLAAATRAPDGAARVAWTDGWRTARRQLEQQLADVGLASETDEAGNLWATLAGETRDTVVLGSHLDSVPNGGDLDGALGVFAAVEVLRAHAASGRRPARTIALVDWADEEGARFGRSLFGSSLVAGTLADPVAVASLSDADGTRFGDVLAAHGVDLAVAVREAPRRLAHACAYLELHIEQGPVLEAEGVPVAAVSGTVGIERLRLRFDGRAAHAGPTPMEHRRDAGLAAAQTALAVEEIARRLDGRGTAGALRLHPGVATVVPGMAELVVDLRHADEATLAAMHEQALQAARKAAGARGCELAVEPLWHIDPLRFDERLVEAARRGCVQAGGRAAPMVSGALHDAAEIGRRVPAAMVFCSSRGGVSHAPDEATDERDLRTAIEVFGRLAGDVIASGAAVSGADVEEARC